MDRVNDTNAFPADEGWEALRCIHDLPLTEACGDCKRWRAGDISPAGEIPADGPDVIRVRTIAPVSRETRPHAATCDLFTGRYFENECTCGVEPLPFGNMVQPPKPVVSRETEPFAELGVWEPSEADYRRWEHAYAKGFRYRWDDEDVWDADDEWLRTFDYRDWEDYA
jgi:hypothetical protein